MGNGHEWKRSAQHSREEDVVRRTIDPVDRPAERPHAGIDETPVLGKTIGVGQGFELA